MNVSSGLAFVPMPISPVYCAAKAGLHSFTESLRVQLKNTKVKVFELAPPATQTELLGDFKFEDMKGVSIMNVEDMVKIAVKGMQTEPGESAKDDESSGAWIYFETNEPIGRSYAQHTQMIRSL